MPRMCESTVAVRVLSNASGESVHVYIDRPVKEDDGGWACKYHIVGDGLDQDGAAHGIDALQALMQAIEGARVALMESIDRVLTWPGGEPGDIGIPRQVPTYVDRNTAQQIERLIDKEIAEWAERGTVSVQPPD